MNDLYTQLQDPDFLQRVRALLRLRDATPEEVAPCATLTIRDSHVQMRSYTCILLGKKPSETAFRLLVEALQSDLDQGVRADAAGALGNLRDPRAYEFLNRAYYEDTEWIVQYSAVVALGSLRDPRTYDLMAAALCSTNALIPQAAISALGELGDRRAVPLLLPFVQSEDWLIRQKVAMALGQLGGAESLAALRYLARDSNAQVVTTVEAVLQELER
ncbi:HEAT repeat domain-containing protein [Anthocerotibacter panamensis]|uniref:HEAT repeat domain-containing protein n=1 Tax=Anthocerotibacter panamensis TaxID=2857077 RepID=UPI001C401C85|nr:HEAT repeat domain-containing protein [Anthocerotibacter panamensis]